MTNAVATKIISDTGQFDGEAAVSVVDSDDVTANYTFENRERYAPIASTFVARGKTLEYSFTPHSFTQIKVKVKE